MSTIGDDPIGEVAKLGFHELEISQVSTNLAVLGFVRVVPLFISVISSPDT